jgi:hypothetical protein
MYRRSVLRLSVLILTGFLAVAPAFASPKSDSPTGPFERIILKIKRVFLPVAAEEPSFPHP